MFGSGHLPTNSVIQKLFHLMGVLTYSLQKKVSEQAWELDLPKDFKNV